MVEPLFRVQGPGSNPNSSDYRSWSSVGTSVILVLCGCIWAIQQTQPLPPLPTLLCHLKPPQPLWQPHSSLLAQREQRQTCWILWHGTPNHSQMAWQLHCEIRQRGNTDNSGYFVWGHLHGSRPGLYMYSHSLQVGPRSNARLFPRAQITACKCERPTLRSMSVNPVSITFSLLSGHTSTLQFWAFLPIRCESRRQNHSPKAAGRTK